MNRESPVPAAIPLFLFTCGLLAAPHLADSRVAAAGLAAAALLLWLGAAPKVRCSLLVLFLALGVWIGERRRAEAEDRQGLLEAHADRFVTVEAILAREWEWQPDSAFSLRVERFSVVEPYRRRIERPLVLHTWSQPPGSGGSRRIVARGFLRATERGNLVMIIKAPLLLSCDGVASPWHPAQWNRRIAARFRQFARQHPRYRRGVALAEALALGRSDQLPVAILDSYRTAGTIHLLVFSGMQIAFLAGIITLALRFLHRPRIADWLLLGLSLVAPPFVGHEPSVERCAWMIGLYALSRILHRPTSHENLLFISALFRLLVRPEEIADAGFALTYAATGGLILIGKPLAARWTGAGRSPGASGAPRWAARVGLLRGLAYGIGAEIGTIPFTLFFFHRAVLASSLLTLVMAPLFALMLAVSLVCCLLVGIGSPLLPLLLGFIEALDEVCLWINGLARLGHLSIRAPSPSAWLIAGGSLLALWVAGVLRGRWRPLALTAILLSVAASSSLAALTRTRVAEPRIEFLDVGQGDAILLRSGEEALLIDGGGGRSRRFGSSVLVPMLVDRGVRRLRAVALTHPHPDHCGGLGAVIDELEVAQLWISPRHWTTPCAADLRVRARERGTEVLLADRLRPVAIGPMRLEAFVASHRFRRAAENNSSVVFRVSVRERAVLLTGDLEKEGERVFRTAFPGALRADVLKVAHHGSQSSTTPDLLAAVGPSIAVISCGRANRFGHPSARVLQDLRNQHVRVYRTDLGGSVTVRFFARHLRVAQEMDTP